MIQQCSLCCSFFFWLFLFQIPKSRFTKLYVWILNLSPLIPEICILCSLIINCLHQYYSLFIENLNKRTFFPFSWQIQSKIHYPGKIEHYYYIYFFYNTFSSFIKVTSFFFAFCEYIQTHLSCKSNIVLLAKIDWFYII